MTSESICHHFWVFACPLLLSVTAWIRCVVMDTRDLRYSWWPTPTSVIAGLRFSALNGCWYDTLSFIIARAIPAPRCCFPSGSEWLPLIGDKERHLGWRSCFPSGSEWLPLIGDKERHLGWRSCFPSGSEWLPLIGDKERHLGWRSCFPSGSEWLPLIGDKERHLGWRSCFPSGSEWLPLIGDKERLLGSIRPTRVHSSYSGPFVLRGSIRPTWVHSSYSGPFVLLGSIRPTRVHSSYSGPFVLRGSIRPTRVHSSYVGPFVLLGSIRPTRVHSSYSGPFVLLGSIRPTRVHSSYSGPFVLLGSIRPTRVHSSYSGPFVLLGSIRPTRVHSSYSGPFVLLGSIRPTRVHSSYSGPFSGVRPNEYRPAAPQYVTPIHWVYNMVLVKTLTRWPPNVHVPRCKLLHGAFISKSTSFHSVRWRWRWRMAKSSLLFHYWCEVWLVCWDTSGQCYNLLLYLCNIDFLAVALWRAYYYPVLLSCRIARSSCGNKTSSCHETCHQHWMWR